MDVQKCLKELRSAKMRVPHDEYGTGVFKGLCLAEDLVKQIKNEHRANIGATCEKCNKTHAIVVLRHDPTSVENGALLLDAECYECGQEYGYIVKDLDKVKWVMED